MKRLIIAVVASLAVSSAVPAQELDPPVIAISAQQLTFTPNEVVLRRGQPVTLRVTSTERIHHFRSRALGFDVDLRPNQPYDITLVPVKAGRFVASPDGHSDRNLLIDIE